MTRALPSLLLLAACAASAGEPAIVIADFERDAAPFQLDKAAIVAEHATSGAKAARIEAGGNLRCDRDPALVGDWSTRDAFVMDVFVPGQQSVQLYIQVRDAKIEPGYWTWHNRYLAVTPGANRIEIPIADLWRGEVLRRDVPGFLDPRGISFIAIVNSGEQPVHVDHVRLESFTKPAVEVPGLLAFDVGPEGSPGFPGFASITEKTMHGDGAAFGWKPGISFANTWVRLGPDNLFRDWLSIADGSLLIDVPNGRYHVWLQLNDAGEWEYVQNFTRRSLTAEGRTVVDETMGVQDFLRKYFRNQDVEDRPGEDPFAKYIETLHPWHEFDVEVADGRLELAFRSPDAYGATLSALVVAPAAERERATRFMEWATENRRKDWSQRWKQVAEPPPPFAMEDARDRRDGFRLYAVSPYAPGSYAGDTAGDPLRAEGPVERLGATLACGEAESVTFGMMPGKPLGRTTIVVSALSNGKDSLPPAEVRVGRYRFCRHLNDQSGMYTVGERELRRFNRTPADELRCDDGFARRFWLTVRAPDGAAAGTYRGSVTIATEHGGTRSIPLEVEVLPFTLPKPDHTFMVYGSYASFHGYYPELRSSERRLAETEVMLQDMADHGLNGTVEVSVGVAASFRNGRVEVANLDEVDAFFALLDKHGFREMPVSFPVGGDLDALAAGKAIEGLDCAAFIDAWYGQLTRMAAERGWPHPAFRFGDEPNTPETLARLTAIHDRLHRVSPDIWTTIAYHVDSPEAEAMQKTVDVHELKDFMPLEKFQGARPLAKHLLNSNMGFGRLAYGLHEWRMAAERGNDACITYAYGGVSIDPYFDLDGREGEYVCAPLRLDGSRETTAQWELTREGVDDFRYATALQAVVDGAASAQADVATAKRLLARASELGAAQGHDVIPRLTEWRGEAQRLLAAIAR
ncbi:MAG TPA: hypothetical protein VEL07_10775 [Planctomycetota bacterium]|nr:hypothetical protein [Planctomycetota bacterium]